MIQFQSDFADFSLEINGDKFVYECYLLRCKEYDFYEVKLGRVWPYQKGIDFYNPYEMDVGDFFTHIVKKLIDEQYPASMTEFFISELSKSQAFLKALVKTVDELQQPVSSLMEITRSCLPSKDWELTDAETRNAKAYFAENMASDSVLTAYKHVYKRDILTLWKWAMYLGLCGEAVPIDYQNQISHPLLDDFNVDNLIVQKIIPHRNSRKFIADLVHLYSFFHIEVFDDAYIFTCRDSGDVKVLSDSQVQGLVEQHQDKSNIAVDIESKLKFTQLMKIHMAKNELELHKAYLNKQVYEVKVDVYKQGESAIFCSKEKTISLGGKYVSLDGGKAEFKKRVHQCYIDTLQNQ